MSDNERLSRELRNRADNLGGHPISFDDVKRSANKMKWQQRAAAGAVAAVVLAIAVPVGFAVTGRASNDDGTQVVAPPTETVTETATTTPTINPDGTVTLTAKGAPRGGEPRVVYVYDGQIIEPDGTATDVDYDYSHVAAFGEGWVGQRSDNGNRFVDVIASDGSVEQTYPSAGPIAVSSQLDLVAFFEKTTDGGTLSLYGAGDGVAVQTWSFAKGVNVSPVGILDGASVVYTTAGVDQAVMIAQAGGDTQPLLGTITARGVAYSTQRITGETSIDEMVPESCWNLFDPSGSKLWSQDRCEYTLGAFNSSEDLLLGHPTWLSGIGDGLVSIVDAKTGEALVEYNTPDDAFIANAVWEDESHVLALVHEPDGWFILRLDTVGNIENVNGAALPGDDLSAPVQFGARP